MYDHFMGRRGRAGTGLAWTGATLDLALATAIGGLRIAGGSTGQSRAEGLLPTLAIVAALAAPGVLAMLGIAFDRPVLLGAAGFTCVPLIIVSIAAFPILIAAVVLLFAFTKATAGRRLAAVDAIVLVAFPVPVLVGLWILITQTSQYTYNFAGGGESGEYFTAGHAVLCIALVAADIVGACALALSAPTSRSAYGS
jgi:hypothetical protein